MCLRALAGMLPGRPGRRRARRAPLAPTRAFGLQPALSSAGCLRCSLPAALARPQGHPPHGSQPHHSITVGKTGAAVHGAISVAGLGGAGPAFLYFKSSWSALLASPSLEVRSPV